MNGNLNLFYFFSACKKCETRTECTCVIEPLANTSSLNYTTTPLHHYEPLAAGSVSHQNFSHSHHTHNICNSNETNSSSNAKCEATTALLTVNHQHITYNYPIYHAPASAVIPANNSVLTSPKSTTESAAAHHVCNSSPAATVHDTVNPYNTHVHTGGHDHTKTNSYHSHHYHSSHVVPGYGSDTSLCYNNNCDNITNFNSNLNGVYEYDMNTLRHGGGSHLPLHDLPNHMQQQQTSTISEPAEFINYSDLKYPARALTHSLANENTSTEPEFINYSELKHYPHIMESTATAVQQEIKPTKLLNDEETSSALLYNETPASRNPHGTTSYETCYYTSNSNSSNSTRTNKLEKFKDKYLTDAATNHTAAYEYEHHQYGGGVMNSNYFSNITSSHSQNSSYAGVSNYYDTGTPHSSLHGPPQQNHTPAYDFSSSASSYASTYGYDQVNARSGSIITGPPCHTYAH